MKQGSVEDLVLNKSITPYVGTIPVASVTGSGSNPQTVTYDATTIAKSQPYILIEWNGGPSNQVAMLEVSLPPNTSPLCHMYNNGEKTAAGTPSDMLTVYKKSFTSTSAVWQLVRTKPVLQYKKNL
jgi:hypothetical protein